MFGKFFADEKGQALITVLLLLFFGGLTISAVLGLMGTGLMATQAKERKLQELYAAESGVEKGFWMVTTQTGVPLYGNSTWPDPVSINMTSLNGKAVSGNISYTPPAFYQATATARSSNGSSTTVTATAQFMSNFFANAATSADGLTVFPGATIIGKQVPDYDPLLWPTAADLKVYYRGFVSGNYTSDTIDIASTTSIGPLLRYGNLDIKSTTAGATANLTGTVYVTGDLNIGTTQKDFTLNLNGQTIFVEGTINIGGKASIAGSGCIIAVSDIIFAPKMNSSPDDFVFVMSLESDVMFQPSGDFYGSIAGIVHVTLKPGNTLTNKGPGGKTLNFPIDPKIIVLDNDNDGGTGSDTAVVTVNNVAPSVAALPNATLFSGQSYAVAGSFTDPGADTWTATGNYGDGSGNQTLALTGKTFNLSRTYYVPGSYTVTVTVTDDDGGVGSTSTTVTVKRLVVAIDIKPGSFPNTINLGNKGNVPVGVLTGTYSGVNFDATTIVRSTVFLAGAPALNIGNSPQDIDADADLDMVFHFSTQSLKLTSTSTQAALTGQTSGGIYFEGTDSVRIVPAK